jgi:DNA-binding MarR family transcriptional regulator
MTRKPTSLREELQQTRPFQSQEEEAILAIQRTADQLGRKFTEIIEPHGISAQQYNVLRILRGAGEAGLPTLDIADRMIEKTPGITRLVDKLEAKSFLRRKRCSHDRRQVFCCITERGLKLLAELDEPVTKAAPHLLASLSAKEVESLIRTLQQIRADLQNDGLAEPRKP